MSETDGSPEITKEVFIEDVDAFMQNKAADEVILELQEKLKRNKQYESQVLQRRTRLKSKLPEIQKALDIVDFLISKEGSSSDVTADFELSENVYAKAKLRDVHSVNLWLGAGVMVEYPLQEAKSLLETNLHNCKASIEVSKQNLDLVKDNTTIIEVGMARVFNYDVERRKREAADAEPSS